MRDSLPKSCRRGPAEGRDRPSGWRQEAIRSTAEGRQVVESVAAAMVAAAYSERDLFAVRLALEEAIVNAIEHGNRGDPRKEVRVRYQVDGERVLAEVQDQGVGFDPRQVADPLAPENLDRLRGRGLLLMRSYLSWVRFNRRGNGVRLCRRRSAPPEG